ncbi:3'3'-cGAMP-specific phosphodiesterase 3 [Lentzea sp. NBRC 105346]|uniref:HD domain-containing phosphohydrolase n=1 Tax=Lentzea sp. NBRC 105346 TaxID=3032205 RepID=UPI0024A2628E|nr:HD domain-containing phosphohydrolase [Lentzea sp. NBRC 105346]GLZ32890.1 3'3'-cGAMP-specific phosphodiesterase 3 [Lentzea sp. NBRC 105346]
MLGPSGQDGVRTADVVAALSLASDLGMEVPLENGLRGTLMAMRLCDVLGTGRDTAVQAFYSSLLFYVGCTANAMIGSEVFADGDAFPRYATTSRYGSRLDQLGGMARAVAPPGSSPVLRAMRATHGLYRLARAFPEIVAADCDAARMLTARLGLPAAVSDLFAHADDRWDRMGEDIPLPMRIAQVACDAAIQQAFGGDEVAAQVVRSRAGGAFDPDVAEHVDKILEIDPNTSVWAETLASEPRPHLVLESDAIDLAVSAIGDFADLASPYLVGHSAGVAALAADAGRRCGLGAGEVVALRRAALVHDVGRVAVPVRVWQHAGPLSPDDWERVRLHAYHTERVLTRSPFLASLAPIAAFHHERLDGSGYHRGTSVLGMPGRLLAAADAYHAMTEPRPHRAAMSQAQAADTVCEQVRAGRLDPDAVGAVLAAAGHRAPHIERPAGLTARETEVVGLLARGMQTKQVARVLRISVKTADHHIQNAYRKIGVSTRAGAALFAMQHGLVE